MFIVNCVVRWYSLNYIKKQNIHIVTTTKVTNFFLSTWRGTGVKVTNLTLLYFLNVSQLESDKWTYEILNWCSIIGFIFSYYNKIGW